MEPSYEGERAHGEKLRWKSGEQEVPQNICYFFSDDAVLSPFCPQSGGPVHVTSLY